MSPRVLLLPVAAIYWAVTCVRNWLYNIHVLPSRTFSKPVICVGNITVGGTGKTPVIESIASLLVAQGKQVAVVSRGYRRKSRGLIIAKVNTPAQMIGDEPRQIKSHLPMVDVIVDSDRAAAIDTAIKRGADVVLMDDGMQHRSVTPSALILVCDYARPLWRDFPLPAGNKRESMYCRLRADAVVVNKCPASLSINEAEEIFCHLSLNDGQRIFFTSIAYANFISSDGNALSDSALAQRGAVAVAGIGRPKPFFDEVRYRLDNSQLKTLAFADHHAFSAQDLKHIEALLDEAGPDSVLVTTEKDATRLPAQIASHTVTSLPIKLDVLLGDSHKFNELITHFASSPYTK